MTQEQISEICDDGKPCEYKTAYRNLFNKRADRVQDLQKKVWVAMDKRSCPGVYMTLACDAILEYGCAEIADLKKQVEQLRAENESLQAAHARYAGESEPVAEIKNGLLVVSRVPEGFTGSLYTHPVGYAGSGEAVVTNEMKIECIGEFSWQEEAPYYDEDGELHEDYVATHVVPWDICKDIYKRMASLAPRHPAPAVPEYPIAEWAKMLDEAEHHLNEGQLATVRSYLTIMSKGMHRLIAESKEGQ